MSYTGDTITKRVSRGKEGIEVTHERSSQPAILSQQLLLAVAEELKLPLMQIARTAELAETSAAVGEAVETNSAVLASVQAVADGALRLLDNYALGVRLHLEAAELPKESVSVASVLYDAGQQLDRFAKQYGVDLSLDVAGRYGPVTAHRAGLQAALVSLGATLITALPALGGGQQLSLRLATHRSRYGIVAGVYTDTKQLSQDALRRGRQLAGVSRQPLTGLTHTSGAGIFVADNILQAMQLHLTVSRHHRLYGLATVLPPNPQLSLV